MGISTRFAAMAMIAALTTTAACTTDPETGRKTISKAALGGIGGALGGYLLGDVVGGKHDRTEKILGAGIGAVAGAGIGHYMDEQEKKLRQQTAGTDVEVIRQGDELLLNMPSGVTFATNSYTIQPEVRSTLNQVATTLAQYNKTYIDVYGHTDSTGTDAINNPLSRNRAESVASYLQGRGVIAARIGTQGFGSTRPVASNNTPEGRQANRRVEIKIVPLTEDDVNG